MVLLASRYRGSNGQTRTPLVPSERDTILVNTPPSTNTSSGSYPRTHAGGDRAADTQRMMYLSLTLTQWTPQQSPSQSLPVIGNGTMIQDHLLTVDISGNTSRTITSASAASSIQVPPPFTASQRDIRQTTVLESQHATDRFPRFAYLLRHGTPHPESQSDNGRSRRSADPRSDPGAHASLATNPDARAQCGVGDETALQSCVAASATDTLGLSAPTECSSSSRATTPLCDTFVPSPPGPLLKDQLRFESAPCSELMANLYQPGTTSSTRGGSRAEQLMGSSRTHADSSQSERTIGVTQQSFSYSSNYASNEHEDLEEDDQEEQPESHSQSQTGAQTQTEGQQKKKKTRRAGVAITRVRRMQREVRRLEEEEANAQRQPPGRSLLGLQIHSTSPGPISPVEGSRPGSAATSPTYRQFPGLPFSGAISPQPRSLTSPGLSLARPTPERQSRSEPGPLQPVTGHSRGPAYDRILEDGDDVVLLRLPSLNRAPGSANIWAYGPEERQRPRGGSA